MHDLLHATRGSKQSPSPMRRSSERGKARSGWGGRKMRAECNGKRSPQPSAALDV
ncbi:hypothetical protein N656DRAFT_774204 [Canariomyces notabilis]|uniref:Uncharacterized protein n=1 Tax=Canariomyces notabilis TaxID=2074819 RepID=A0AAN6YW67_9PEZI|nr:hypothetical protein N656DRAFT_774204 [Canariomyces arenarius]